MLTNPGLADGELPEYRIPVLSPTMKVLEGDLQKAAKKEGRKLTLTYRDLLPHIEDYRDPGSPIDMFSDDPDSW